MKYKGNFSFPGIEQPVSATYTLSHGTDPGRIMIRCNPQLNKTFQIGPFQMDWEGTIVKIPDCRIVSDRVTLDGGGFVTSVELEDYRWKWRYPVIDGQYNVRNDYQSIYKPTKKNPRELAKLLLKQLGVKDSQMNVAALPTDDYPSMEWYSTPVASELSSLAERYGCRVVPWPDGRVNIFEIGKGNFLPVDLPTDSDSMGVVSPSGPDSVEVHFGPTKHRVVCALEPVGLDVDGKVKPVDKLSYKPASGWYGEDPGSFYKLQASLGGKPRYGERLFILDLARRSVFKWYRITTSMPGLYSARGSVPLTIPGYKNKINSIAQLLPIDDRVQNVGLDVLKPTPGSVSDGSKDTDEFWDFYDFTMVWGEFFKKNMNGLAPVWPDYNWYKKREGGNFYFPGGYSIDRERGIVQFDDYVFSLEDRGVSGGSQQYGKRIFPDLALSFMCSPRNDPQRQMDKYTVEVKRTDIKPSGTKPLALLHPEFQLIKTFDIQTNGQPGPVRELNRKLLDKVGKYYANAEIRKYRKQEPRMKVYNGLWPIFTTGTVREVTFSMHETNGMTTTACYNDERQPYVLPYEVRRRDQRINANIRTDEFAPPVFRTPPQTFPYNLSSSYFNVSPSRR